jgi:hypothetical protein
MDDEVAGHSTGHFFVERSLARSLSAGNPEEMRLRLHPALGEKRP